MKITILNGQYRVIYRLIYYFGDRDFTITSLPDVLRGAEWIRTS